MKQWLNAIKRLFVREPAPPIHLADVLDVHEAGAAIAASHTPTPAVERLAQTPSAIARTAFPNPIDVEKFVNFSFGYKKPIYIKPYLNRDFVEGASYEQLSPNSPEVQKKLDRRNARADWITDRALFKLEDTFSCENLEQLTDKINDYLSGLMPFKERDKAKIYDTETYFWVHSSQTEATLHTLDPATYMHTLPHVLTAMASKHFGETIDRTAVRSVLIRDGGIRMSVDPKIVGLPKEDIEHVMRVVLGTAQRSPALQTIALKGASVEFMSDDAKKQMAERKPHSKMTPEQFKQEQELLDILRSYYEHEFVVEAHKYADRLTATINVMAEDNPILLKEALIQEMPDMLGDNRPFSVSLRTSSLSADQTQKQIRIVAHLPERNMVGRTKIVERLHEELAGFLEEYKRDVATTEEVERVNTSRSR